VESKTFQIAVPMSNVASSGFRTELPEETTSTRCDGVDDNEGAVASPTMVFSWARTMDPFDNMDGRKSCLRSVEKRELQSTAQRSSTDIRGIRTELPEKKSSIRFDDVDDDGGALASPTIVFSWARTMDPFDSIDNVQEYGGPENLGKSCSRSVDKKEFQIPAPMSNTAYGGIRTELPEKKPSIRFDDGEDSPAVTSPTMAFSWARTMDPFECVDDVQNDGGLAESEELSTSRNLQNEALHLRGECQPCAYFALRADGCRRGKLCEFCHLCDKKEIKRRKRQYRKSSK